MKIYKVRGCEKLSKWDYERIRKGLPNADMFIYNYENYGYEGSGFALWRVGKKFGYAYLGHCSCNGPVEDLNSALFNMSDIKKLASGNNYEWKHAGPVLAKYKELTTREAEVV